jgi:hypothetical protein
MPPKGSRRTALRQPRQPRTPVLDQEDNAVKVLDPEGSGGPKVLDPLDLPSEEAGALPPTYSDLLPGTIFRRTPDSPAEKKPWTQKDLEKHFSIVSFMPMESVRVQRGRAVYHLQAGQNNEIPSIIRDIALNYFQEKSGRIVPSADGKGADYIGVDGLHVLGTGFLDEE